MRRAIIPWCTVAAVLMLEAACALALDTANPSPQWVTRSWQTTDGLPQESVSNILQTRDGFLWVGMGAGVARFDGVRFRKFGLQDGLRSVRVTALVEDSAGSLWVGTSGGGVSRWDGSRFTSFDGDNGFPSGLEVISLAADREGSVWIGTDKGLVQWTGGTFKMAGAAEGLPRKQVRALLCDSQGTLWVSVLLNGLFHGRNGRFTRMEGDDPKPASIYSLCEGRDGVIWAGSDALWKWSGGKWERFHEPNGLPRAMIQSVVQGRDGTVWAGTRRGLYRGSGTQFERAAAEGPLSEQSVGALITDRDGAVWAGPLSGGLHRLSPRVLQYWSKDDGLGQTAVTSVVGDAAGGLWAGTASRGIHRLENGRFVPLADPKVSDSQIIYCMTSSSDGAVWAAGEGPVFRFQPGQPTQSYHDPPVRGEAIRALCADGETLWFGTYNSTLLKRDATGIHVMAPPGSFPGTISCILREAADTLWIGTSAGLHRWERGSVQSWSTRDGLLTGYIRCLHRDPDGTLWIGTLGGGLARMKAGRFVHVTTRQGLVDDAISQILPDDFECLWLGCNRGLMRVRRQELNAFADGAIPEVHPTVMGRNEGMLAEQCFGGTSPTALKSREGVLYFPTMNGLAGIDPRKLQSSESPAPQASIEEIRVDQNLQVPGARQVIPPGPHRIEIAYTAPLLHGGEWVRLRHRLEGFDDDWRTAERNRLASYDSLPPGDYVFRVAAADRSGNWTQPGASVAFTVLPFFWETLWFRAGGILLLAGGSGAAAWWHLRSKHRRQLAELERERKLHAELAHASRVSTAGQLTAALAHELNQPLGIILSNAQAARRMLSGEFPDVAELREILDDIVAEDRRAGEVIRRLRALLQRGETRFLQIPPNEIIEDVLRLLRSELISRGVTVRAQLAPGLPDIAGDQVQLQQVVMNIIINACDAMKDNPPQERILRIATDYNNGMVRLSLQDEGCGLPDGDSRSIFQSFFTTKSEGMGIGLSICRSIIAAHHGSLWAEANTDAGTTFHIELRTVESSTL